MKERNVRRKDGKIVVIELEDTFLTWKDEKNDFKDIGIEYGNEKKGWIKLRSYALSFLQIIAESFEIVIYSCMENDKLKAIVDFLDPKGTIFSSFLGKESCFPLSEGIIGKDLRILNCDLS